MRAFTSILLLASPFLTNALLARNGGCSQILAKKSSWGSGAQYRTSFNSVGNPDWKMTLNFDAPLAAFQAADGIVNTRDLQTIEIRPKSYLKTAPTGSGLEMLVKFRNGQQANLKAVSLNGYTYSCDSVIQVQEENSVGKFFDVDEQSLLPNPAYDVFKFDGDAAKQKDCADGEDCKNYKKKEESHIYCKFRDGEMKCSFAKVTKETEDIGCPTDEFTPEACKALKPLCNQDKKIASQCFTTCFCA